MDAQDAQDERTPRQSRHRSRIGAPWHRRTAGDWRCETCGALIDSGQSVCRACDMRARADVRLPRRLPERFAPLGLDLMPADYRRYLEVVARRIAAVESIG